MCESFLLKAQSDEVVIGRTMEFPPLKLKLPHEEALGVNWFSCHVPAGTEFHSYISKQSSGIGYAWKNIYNFIGLTALNEAEGILLGERLNPSKPVVRGTFCSEGINDQGMSVSVLTYDANMQWPTAKGGGFDILFILLADYMLGMYDTVKSLKAGFQTNKINPFGLTGENAVINQPAHFIVHDKSGDCLIIEVDSAGPKLYDADYIKTHNFNLFAKALNGPMFGLLTNAPSLDWHYNHFRQYLHLNPHDPTLQPEGAKIGHMTQTSHGSGMIGLPGDYTSPSRFVRLANLLRYTPQPATVSDAIALANHMLNTATIIEGLVMEDTSSSLLPKNDITQWVTIKQLSGGSPKMYCRTYYAFPIGQGNMYQEFTFQNFPAKLRYAPIEHWAPTIKKRKKNHNTPSK